MLWAVASVPCQKYIKDRIFTHVLFYPSNSCFFFSHCSDLPFENFILHLHYGFDIRNIFKTTLDIKNTCVLCCTPNMFYAVLPNS